MVYIVELPRVDNKNVFIEVKKEIISIVAIKLDYACVFTLTEVKRKTYAHEELINDEKNFKLLHRTHITLKHEADNTKTSVQMDLDGFLLVTVPNKNITEKTKPG